MQVCITGANGFIGRQLMEALSRNGYSIRILTRRDNPIVPSNVEIINGDLTEPDCPLNQFLDGCDVLFHCAGEIRHVNSMRLLHVDGTKRLIQSALYQCSLGNRKIHWVQLSSCGCYGPPIGRPHTDRVVTETTPNRPVNEYEFTKTASDNLLIEACKEDGPMTFSILRPSNVFGAAMTNQSLLKVINLVKRGRFVYLGRPGAIATYVHVNDVVGALLTLAIDPRAKGEVYNLSSDCTFEQLIIKIASLLCVPEPTIRIPAPLIRIPIGMLATLLKKWIRIPGLDALVLRTRYPANKIESELGFVFSMPMPNAIEDLTSVPMFKRS